jgi:hypothetical protein
MRCDASVGRCDPHPISFRTTLEETDAVGCGRPVLGSITIDRNRDYEVAGMSSTQISLGPRDQRQRVEEQRVVLEACGDAIRPASIDYTRSR